MAQAPRVTEIVSRMQAAESRQQASSSAYTATREYLLSASQSQKPTVEVVAEISFIPPLQKNYSIRKVEGSERGAGIIRKVLDHESEVTAHRERVALTDANYSFALLGEEQIGARTCYVLQLTPKREIPDLLRGKAWIDADTFLVRRLEGHPAKSPSWWIRDLNLTVEFGEAEGVWTQTASRASAEVRFAGQHVLTSRAIDIRTTAETASVNAPSHPPHHENVRRSYTNASVWMPR